MTSRASGTQQSVILAGFAGNVMEWYDFCVYGYFAGIIGHLFFPAGNRVTSLLAAFGVFAAGFLMRPLGSLAFGHLGDKKGRKPALTVSVALMAVPTFLIGLLPTYHTVGVLAPALLVLMRLLQGLSVGGEYTTSSILLVEDARVSASRDPRLGPPGLPVLRRRTTGRASLGALPGGRARAGTFRARFDAADPRARARHHQGTEERCDLPARLGRDLVSGRRPRLFPGVARERRAFGPVSDNGSWGSAWRPTHPPPPASARRRLPARPGR